MVGNLKRIKAPHEFLLTPPPKARDCFTPPPGLLLQHFRQLLTECMLLLIPHGTVKPRWSKGLPQREAPRAHPSKGSTWRDGFSKVTQETKVKAWI